MQTIPPTYSIMDNKWMEHELTYKDNEVEKEEQVLENIATKRECHGEIFFVELRARRFSFMRQKRHHSVSHESGMSKIIFA